MGIQDTVDLGKITYSNVENAIMEIEKDGYNSKYESIKYDLVYEGYRYPPKYVLSLASKDAFGVEGQVHVSRLNPLHTIDILENLKFEVLLKRNYLSDFRALFEEFVSNYLTNDFYKEILGEYIEADKRAKDSVDLIKHIKEESRIIDSNILFMIIPHPPGAPRTLELNAWSHPATSIHKNGDIIKYLESVHQLSENDIQRIANALVDFYYNCLVKGNPLKEECDRYAQLNLKGLQMGFITQLLNAYDPEHFTLITDQTISVIDCFSETNFKNKSSLAYYPELNRCGIRLYKSVLNVLENVKMPGVKPSDLFSLFCYWLIRDKKWVCPKGSQIEYFILRIGGGDYKDSVDQRYHFKKNIPGYKQLIGAQNNGKFVYLEAGNIIGNGGIGQIIDSKDKGYYAEIKNYEKFLSPISFDKVKHLFSINNQSGINKIDEGGYEYILSIAGQQTSPIQPIHQGSKWGDLEAQLSCNFSNELVINDLYFDDTTKKNIICMVASALINGKHIILIGPPGTGKSKLAGIICKTYIANNYSMYTATSDWSTYETIGGYRPDNNGKLDFYPGVFLRCFQNEAGTTINKWIIIDEINRADIDKAFGPFFSVLTRDNITLPFEKCGQTGEKIEIIGCPKADTEIKSNLYLVHPDWRIIATMNTFDKSSLYELSYAFMRRFAFIPVDVPSKITKELIAQYANIWRLKIDDTVCNNLAQLWGVINEKRKIGPSIIEDVCRYMIDNPTDYTGAIIMFVLPQFEGLMDGDQKKLVNKILSLTFINDNDRLRQFTQDYLGIELKPEHKPE